MTTLTVTSKGQITLKKEILRHLGVKPGDQLMVHMLPEGELKVEAAKPGGSIDDFCGIFQGCVDRPVTIEEMNEVIADGWAGRL
ncbi:MAG: AbrB/MazE/SpoVT family DNA-binding domain-containing protein [Propionibacteriaceae bacterium]|nr:AbrB/MazE/SpoVT family DNA-binding domain-containing protein [Propionibacteriaceae bacterium]